MITSSQKIVEKGDLAVYNRETSGIKKVCLIVAVNPILGSGFQSAEIIWCGADEIETVMIQYLKVVQKSNHIFV